MDHENLHFIRFVVNKELNELYIAMVIRTLAFSMIGVFVPLFLYKELGYGLSEIIYFYLVYAFMFGLFTLPGAKLSSKIGLKHVILISSPIYVVYFGFLYLLKSNPGLFFIIPVLYGAADALFWIAFHIDFSMFSDKKKRGEEIGVWYSFSILAGLVGPFVGGLILTFSNFNLLFFIVAVLCIGSVVPLFFSAEVKKGTKHLSWNFFRGTNLKEFFAFVGVGARIIVATVFWPVFIYMILKGYLMVGSLATIVGVFNVIFTFFIGKLTDIYNKRFIIRVSSVLHAVTWFVRVFIKTWGHLVFVAILGGITIIGVDLPFTALTYDKANKRPEYLVFRELSLCFGRILVLLLVLLTGNLLSSFVYAGLATLAHVLL